MVTLDSHLRCTMKSHTVRRERGRGRGREKRGELMRRGKGRSIQWLPYIHILKSHTVRRGEEGGGGGGEINKLGG